MHGVDERFVHNFSCKLYNVYVEVDSKGEEVEFQSALSDSE
jgi:hypothetical protein